MATDVKIMPNCGSTKGYLLKQELQECTLTTGIISQACLKSLYKSFHDFRGVYSPKQKGYRFGLGVVRNETTRLKRETLWVYQLNDSSKASCTK